MVMVKSEWQQVSSILFLFLFLCCTNASGSETGKVADIFQQILLLKSPKSSSQHLESHVKKRPTSNGASLVDVSHTTSNVEGLPHLLKRLSHAKKKAEATRIAIRRKWEIPDEFETVVDKGVGFTPGLGDVSVTASSKANNGNNGPARDVLIGKFMKLLLSNTSPTFTVAFAGTSVSAGHDNWFNQSYAHSYERAFKPAMKAGRIQLSVRNHAMGGNSITPSHFCARAQLDNNGDLDLVVYEFAMIANRNDCRMESFMRSIMLLPKSPAFMAYTTSGVSWREEKDKAGNAIPQESVKPATGDWAPKLLTKQTCNNKWVIDYYANNGAHYGDLGYIIHKIGHLPPFTSEKMMGSKAIHGGDKPTKVSVALGVEDDDENENENPNETRRRRRLAPFHPGPGAHEWQGQMLAHAHLKLYIEAINLIEAEANNILLSHGWSSANVLEEQMETLSGNLIEKGGKQKWYLTPGMNQLPKPIGCYEAYCASRSTQCFTSYTPHGPQASIESLIKGEPLYNPFPPALTLSSSPSSSSSSAVPSKDRWQFAMPPAMSFQEHASYGYLDFKFALKGDKLSGKLEFDITTTLDNSPIVVCQPQCPWGKCKANQRLLNDAASVKWFLDNEMKQPPDVASLPKHDAGFDKSGTCLVVAYAKQTGKHTLGVEVIDGNVFISHVLFY